MDDIRQHAADEAIASFKAWMVLGVHQHWHEVSESLEPRTPRRPLLPTPKAMPKAADSRQALLSRRKERDQELCGEDSPRAKMRKTLQ